MQTSGQIAQRAVLDSIANLGVHEVGGNNRGRAVETYLAAAHALPGDAWCAAFQSYRLQMAAKELHKTLPADFPISAYCPDYKNYGVKNGLWLSIDEFQHVQRGDLCCFWFAAKSRIAHIGIVSQIIDVQDHWFSSIEGNTHADTAEVVSRDGDGVYKKKRRVTQLGERGGFVRLPF